MPEPLPFGHDPEKPPYDDIRSSEPEVVRGSAMPGGVALIRVVRVFQHVAQPEPPPPLVLSAEQLARDEADKDVEERLLARMRKIRLYYTTFDPPEGFPAGVLELPDNPAQEAEQEFKASFESIFKVEPEAKEVTVFTLELKAERPKEDDPPLGVGVTIDPYLYGGELDGYVAKCTTSAYAYVRALDGGVRLRMFKSGVSIGVVEEWYGGGPSPTLGTTTRTRATFDIAVRGLGRSVDLNHYGASVGWSLGTGGGC
jgi:hypothetical protein